MTSAIPTSAGLTSDQRSAFAASLLGWMMDAFDYFIVVLIYADIGKDFGVSLETMAYLTTITLAMRPVGAYLFGIWADRVGRRTPLIVNVCFYSVIGFACAFAPNFTVLFILRLLYGIGMGGEWGLGAALTMEKMPRHRRGFFSGILQAGYSGGYLLASVLFLVIISAAGLSWRWMFAFSILPALISLIIRTRVKESEVWVRTQERLRRSNSSIRRVFFNGRTVRRFIYLVILMAAFNWMSHGTQDVYPTFLKATDDGGAGIGASTATWIAIIYNVGAIFGAIVFGSLSDRWGRKAIILLGSLLTLPLIPLFAFSKTAFLLCLGSALTQFMVQGAWGAIPAHLNEMSPNAIRGFYPGVTYQLGNVLAAFNLPIQQALAPRIGYPTTIAVTTAFAAIFVFVMCLVGKQAKGIDFNAEDPDDAPRAGAGPASGTAPAR